jgi:hypothetical protein
MTNMVLEKVRITVPHTHVEEFQAILESLLLPAELIASDGNGMHLEVGADADKIQALRDAAAHYPGIQIGT